MAAGGNETRNEDTDSSLKENAFALLNLFHYDLVQPSDSGDTVRENRAMGQEHLGNGNQRFLEEVSNSGTNQELVQENQDGAIWTEHLGNVNQRVQEEGNNSGTNQELVQENQDGGIGPEHLGNVNQRVQEESINNGANQINVQDNQEPTVAPKQEAQQAEPLTKTRIQEIIHKAVGVLVKAVEEEKQNSKLDAFKLYKKGLELLMIVYKEPTLEGRMKATLRSKISLFLTKAEHMKEHLKQEKNSDNCAVCGPNKVISNEELETKTFFESFIMDKNVKIKFEEIKGQTEALQSLKENLILPLKFPQLFVGRYRTFTNNTLLFGHPGTGKTMMMTAIATELPTFNFLKLSVWDLTSRFFSDRPERAVKDLFRFFYDKSPCVLILEDLDVMDRHHSSDEENQRWRQIKTEFLVQYEGFNKDERAKEKKLAMVFVTQKPWCLASPFRRRIYKRIFFDLPTKQARIEILKSGLNGVRHKLGADNFYQLGDKTISACSCRFTQADLVCLCRDAMMQSVRRVQEARYFKQVTHLQTKEEGFWTPCYHGEDGATEMSWTDIDGHKVLEPELEMSNFLDSLKKFHGTVDSEFEARMQQWVEDFVS